MSELVIRAESLEKSFGDKQVLRGLSLSMARGQLIALIGPNGAGKSTLLRALIGLIRCEGGSIRVLGIDPDLDALAIRRRTCYLPGETSVYHQMTGQQFLDFALGFYPRRQEELLQDFTDHFALPLRNRVRSYSAGMKQKLAIMATLGPDLDLYLLDEPDRALDASMRFFLRDVLRRQRRAGKTILLSSHHLSEVESLADRLDFLVDGNIVPEAGVAAARQALRRRVRLRLIPGTGLPAGASLLATEPDGTIVLQVDGEPLDYLSRLPATHVLGAEVGAVRLEDLYQQLTEATVEVPS